MRGNPGRGALAGFCFGMAGMSLLILLPPAIQTDWYEITDPLLIMGLPMVVIATCLGALIGVKLPDDADHSRPSRARTGATMAVVVAVAGMAVWFFLWGTGAVAAPASGVG